MSTKEISGFLTILPDRSEMKPNDPVQTEVQAGNVFFKNVTRRRTIFYWDNNNGGSAGHQSMKLIPWKNASLLLDDDDTVGHSNIGNEAYNVVYPTDPPSPNIGTYAYHKFRLTGTAGTMSSATLSRVIGAIAASDQSTSIASPDYWQVTNSIISINDVPKEYTQIGIVYQHPMVWGQFADTTVGLSYLSYSNLNYLDSMRMSSHCHNLVRIYTGADQGLYLVRYPDLLNNRLYLTNLDGSIFVGQATTTGNSVNLGIGPGRRAYYNEVSIIQFSAGTVITGGTFRPGATRASFMMRVVYEKTGSDATAAGAEQQGSYFITMRPYTHGDGLYGDNGTGALTSGVDVDEPTDNMLYRPGGTMPFGINFFDGGANGMALDEPNQRLWFGYTNNSNQSAICHWRWKTVEGFREVANYLGTPAQGSFLSTPIALTTGDMIRDLRYSPTGRVYISIGHATAGNGGIAIINSGATAPFTTSQYNTGTLIAAAASLVSGTALDTTRARTGTSGDVTTTISTNEVNSTSGAFTNADIGRVIVLTGGTNNNGSYLIASAPSATQVTVTTTGGGVVSFGSGGTGGTFQIGERLYLFFGNTTTGAGKINYMESLLLGTFLTRTVSMTNGANCKVQTQYGEQSKVAIDPANGNVYWLSGDVQQQINKYDVTANTHSFLTVANVQSPSGGTGTITNMTGFTAIHVNSKFDEIWVGCDFGHIKLVKSTFAAATAKRYFGDDTTTYANPAGFFRPSGNRTSAGVNDFVRSYYEHPDGRMSTSMTGTNTSINVLAYYHRTADLWEHRVAVSSYTGGVMNGVANMIYDSIGVYFYVHPRTMAYANGEVMVGTGSVEVQYQWDNPNSKWIPLEVVYGALPNKSPTDTISPGLMCKPMHSGLEDVLYGVKLGFTPQIGPIANNQFLGRNSQTTLTKTDGATAGTTTFTGSGFTAGDAGKLLRIENSTVSADIGVYKVSAFLSTTTLTLTKLNGATFAPGTASSIQYTLWDHGVASSTAGAEVATVLLADGFGKDNTQDISGITYDSFLFKTVLQEQVEGTKFCLSNPIAVPGGLEMKVYYDFFPRQGSAVLASHDLATTQIRALPVAEWTDLGFDGRKLVDGFSDGLMDGTTNRGRMWSSPSNANIWYGTVSSDGFGFLNPVGSNLGNCPMVDLGADAEVGFVIVRGHTITGQSLTWTAASHGLKATLYKAANAGGTPVASSTSRTSGTTNLTLTANNNTISVAGDFLGAITTGPLSNGSATAGQSTFNAPVSTFVQSDVSKILKITSIGDVGSYRIIAVDGTGAIATVQNLNQTAKAWLGTTSSIVYEVRDGVKEEDVICVPSIAAPSQRLCIERLLSPTTAQVRVAPHSTAASQSWQCAVPTWDKVKRVSHSTEATPPDVKNNKTWVSMDGRELLDILDFKIYMDLTDLTVAQRTGRWWQLQCMPRGINNNSGDYYYSTFEFYSPTGARLGVSQNTWTDNALQNVDFLSSHINRLDFVQGSNSAINAAGFNGTVDIGGANGDTLTLTTGGNKFLGFQVRRPYSDGVSTAGAGGNFASATAVFVTSDVGRILHITSGADTGYYRIATRTATTATVTTPSGGAVTFTGATGAAFSIHEGFSVTGAAPDRIVFLDDTTSEYTLASINDALTSITILEARQPSSTAHAWEVRRPAFDTTSAAVDSTKLARLVRPETTYPLQMGDVTHDSRGALRFWVDDIGSGNSRSDGSVTGGDGVFVGSGFCFDDVGRFLYITTGVTANRGIWKISAFTSSTSITVVNAYTGVAAVFSADAAADKVYKIFGDRRYKITKQVTTLRA